MIETMGEPGFATTERRVTMAGSDEQLRALIRLIPPARALKEELEKSIHLELYAGTGDLAVRSFQGLQASVNRISADPYVASLELQAAPAASDREKVSLSLLAAGQLLAYLEGQTGVAGLTKSGDWHLQTAPNIAVNNIEGLGPGGADKVMEMITSAVKGKERGEETGQGGEG